MRDSARAVWFHYSLWEDWHAGLYSNRYGGSLVVDRVVALLSDPGAFWLAMATVAEAWPVATIHNLSNESRNHRPWLGRAAGCHQHQASLIDTNAAWALLSASVQDRANREADRFCFEWRSGNLAGQLVLAI